MQLPPFKFSIPCSMSGILLHLRKTVSWQRDHTHLTTSHGLTSICNLIAAAITTDIKTMNIPTNKPTLNTVPFGDVFCTKIRWFRFRNFELFWDIFDFFRAKDVVSKSVISNVQRRKRHRFFIFFYATATLLQFTAADTFEVVDASKITLKLYVKILGNYGRLHVIEHNGKIS